MIARLSAGRQNRPLDAAWAGIAGPGLPAPAATNFVGQLGLSDRVDLRMLARPLKVRRGEYVYQAGDKDRNVYILLSGRVKLFRESSQGREVILWFCFQGEIFGMSEVHDAKGRRASVQACEDSHLAFLSEDAFNGYLDTHPAASRTCRRVLSARLGILSHVLVNLTADDARTRLAKLMLHLGARYGLRKGLATHLHIRLTHQEIANMIGVNRQTTSMLIGELKGAGLIEIVNHRILIVDERALADVALRDGRR